VVTLRHFEASHGARLALAAVLVSITGVVLIRLRLIGPDGLRLTDRLPPRFATLPRLLGLLRPAAAGVSS
jgi:hypothetical protein